MTVTETPVEDSLFGPLTVRLDTERGEVVVEGEAIPLIVLSRAAGTETDDHIPVGTRDGGRLTLTVAGEEASVYPAKGRLTRRSFRVDVRHAGHVWRLVPDSLPGSRFLRDGRRLGDFFSEGDGEVTAEWRPETGPDIEPGIEPDSTDAALGYALAAAFGTGAQPMWMLVGDAIGDLIP
ncbi:MULTISPECIES: hypothetical protein [unclassified Streptomyces]|uniref:hypothetical protein n=1 Tax=unclassified Streptomyces TaxID=2593676 RepID=UPI0023657EAC|nr:MULTISPECIES: hypothetical protein [unclassified Streptomyces]MDF3140685.1 hypothetical protein [Streptomyces sp. T21Q-yed]WDF40029.1 hypothetical protein PBV52_26230 [Streptomyces sp. T12]